MITSGLIDVYVSTDFSDVSVTVDRETWTHQLSFRQGIQFVRSRLVDDTIEALVQPRSVEINDRLAEGVGTHGVGEKGLERRALQHSSVSPAEDVGLYRFVSDERLSLTVPHEGEGFVSNNFYVTVFARERTQFYFYYRQDSPRLNLYVFFSIFLCYFLLASGAIVSVYELGCLCVRQRRRRLERQRQERRANRPLVKVVVYFGGGEQQPSSLRQAQQLLQTSSRGMAADTGIFKSVAEEKAGRDHKRKPAISRTAKDETVGTENNKTAAEIELETHKGLATSKDSDGQKKKKKKYQRLSVDDIQQWPVCIQPTADEVCCLGTMLVKLPSSNGQQQLCTGSALLNYPKATFEERNREREKRRLRLRRKNRLAPAPNTTGPSLSSTTTQL